MSQPQRQTPTTEMNLPGRAASSGSIPGDEGVSLRVAQPSRAEPSRTAHPKPPTATMHRIARETLGLPADWASEVAGGGGRALPAARSWPAPGEPARRLGLRVRARAFQPRAGALRARPPLWPAGSPPARPGRPGAQPSGAPTAEPPRAPPGGAAFRRGPRGPARRAGQGACVRAARSGSPGRPPGPGPRRRRGGGRRRVMNGRSGSPAPPGRDAGQWPRELRGWMRSAPPRLPGVECVSATLGTGAVGGGRAEPSRRAASERARERAIARGALRSAAARGPAGSRPRGVGRARRESRPPPPPPAAGPAARPGGRPRAAQRPSLVGAAAEGETDMQGFVRLRRPGCKML